MNNNPQQAALYQALSERVKPLLEPVFAQQPTIMDAYLQLVAEAIHCHYLHPPALQSHWHTARILAGCCGADPVSAM